MTSLYFGIPGFFAGRIKHIFFSHYWHPWNHITMLFQVPFEHYSIQPTHTSQQNLKIRKWPTFFCFQNADALFSVFLQPQLPSHLDHDGQYVSRNSGTSQKENTLKLRQNGWHFSDNIFKHIFFDENVWISLKISLGFVPRVWINNIPALVQIMACHRPGDKPLSEPMMVSLLTHICITRPQLVKSAVYSVEYANGLLIFSVHLHQVHSDIFYKSVTVRTLVLEKAIKRPYF